MLYFDTSVLVPLFLPEDNSAALRAWLESHRQDRLALSDWGLTEFSSALGIKVREKRLKPAQARTAASLLMQLVNDSFELIVPSRRHFSRATVYLDQHALGLRAGDALHLAIAAEESASCAYSLDRKFLLAARALKVPAAAPV